MARNEKYMISWGPLFEKTHEGKEEGKTKRTGKSFIRIWTTEAFHMLRGLNVDARFGSLVVERSPTIWAE